MPEKNLNLKNSNGDVLLCKIYGSFFHLMYRCLERNKLSDAYLANLDVQDTIMIETTEYLELSADIEPIETPKSTANPTGFPGSIMLQNYCIIPYALES